MEPALASSKLGYYLRANPTSPLSRTGFSLPLFILSGQRCSDLSRTCSHTGNSGFRRQAPFKHGDGDRSGSRSCCCCVLRKASFTSFSGELSTDGTAQGRAGIVALRKYRGGAAGVSALGKAYYKGGFEPKMNRREASLILQLKYDVLPGWKYKDGELTF